MFAAACLLLFVITPSTLASPPRTCADEVRAFDWEPPAPGQHVPQCDRYGDYEPLQCSASSGRCWCVDEWGGQLWGTETGPGQEPTYCPEHGDASHEPTKCELERDSSGSRPGLFKPQCDSNGNYEKVQCHGSTGQCWCVNAYGSEKSGTRTYPGDYPNCNASKSRCQKKRDYALKRNRKFVPTCDQNGNYNAVQCDMNQRCWCVDTNGRKDRNTVTRSGDMPPIC